VLELAGGESLPDNLHPLGALYYAVSLLYCLPASLAAGGPGLGSLGLPATRLAEIAAGAGFPAVRRVLDTRRPTCCSNCGRDPYRYGPSSVRSAGDSRSRAALAWCQYG
jgi:hypothetical protein